MGQVREVAARLAELAKAGGTCVALVGHVTKEGTVAGPRTLEHLVDAVIYLEGERLGSTRLLRAAKNRFGSTDEVGVLEMRGDGLAEVADASRFFLESDETPTAGSRSPSPSRGRGRWRSRSRPFAQRPATGRRGGRRPASTRTACSCSSRCLPAMPD